MAQYRIAGMLVCAALWIAPAFSALAADSRLQVLNFSMERCEPCRAMEPVLAKLIMDGWQIRHVDIAQEPQFAAQFKLKSAPTLVILSDGRELDRIVGAIAYNKLLARLEAASRAAHSATIPGGSSAAQSVASATQPFASQESSAPPTLSQRGPTAGSLSLEPPLVRGQSPGPADVPDLDVDSQRMLDFVKDLPEPPAMVQPAAHDQSAGAQPSMVGLAAASSSGGRNEVQPSASRPAQTVQPQADPISRAQLATVRIRLEDAHSLAFGTGTVIYVHNGQALVLTCGHLFRDLAQGTQMSVDVFDKAGRPTNVPAQVVSHTTEDGDIGLMEFRCPYPITPVPISRQAPTVGEVAFSFGCDRGADPTRRDTRIKRINRYIGPANVEILGAPVLGRSGGGLFNAQGQVIGVCNSADAADDEGIYAALPVIEQHVAALRLDSLPSDEAVATHNPMQLASATRGIAAGQSASALGLQASTQASQPSVAQPATQVRCVIRDAQGKETALLIERPSEELVAMLRQNARK